MYTDKLNKYLAGKKAHLFTGDIQHKKCQFLLQKGSLEDAEQQYIKSVGKGVDHFQG